MTYLMPCLPSPQIISVKKDLKNAADISSLKLPGWQTFILPLLYVSLILTICTLLGGLNDVAWPTLSGMEGCIFLLRYVHAATYIVHY